MGKSVFKIKFLYLVGATNYHRFAAVLRHYPFERGGAETFLQTHNTV
jgi:hypothetical protein